VGDGSYELFTERRVEKRRAAVRSTHVFDTLCYRRGMRMAVAILLLSACVGLPIDPRPKPAYPAWTESGSRFSSRAIVGIGLALDYEIQDAARRQNLADVRAKQEQRRVFEPLALKLSTRCQAIRESPRQPEEDRLDVNAQANLALFIRALDAVTSDERYANLEIGVAYTKASADISTLAGRLGEETTLNAQVRKCLRDNAVAVARELEAELHRNAIY
jgi:hypothetical protein